MSSGVAAAAGGLLVACRGPGARSAGSTTTSAGSGPAPSAGPANSGAAASGPALTTDADLHFAPRLTYGLTPGLLAEIKGRGRQAWVEDQLKARTPDALVSGLPLVGAVPSGLDRNDQRARAEAAAQLQQASVVRQVHSPAQLYEQMVEFWTNHLSIYLEDGAQRVLKLADDRDVIRRHALGRFADLLKVSAQSPAMLLYLDNASSAKGHINENYGRELLELHTVGVDAGYSEADVVATSNVLTGWTVAPAAQGGGYRFTPGRHDDTPQSVMTWRTPAGATGEAQGTALLDYLAHHPATAHFLARKLVVRFVSEAPDAGLVDTVATAYLAADTDITATLRTLINDERFQFTAQPKFRRPNEWLVAAVRAVGGRVSASPLAAGPARQFIQLLAALGQAPMSWPAPNGYPDVAPAWLNAGGLLTRWNTAADLVSGVLPAISVDASGLGGGSGPGASGPAGLVAALAPALLGESVDPGTDRAVSQGVLAAAKPEQLHTALALLLSTPRFQYR